MKQVSMLLAAVASVWFSSCGKESASPDVSIDEVVEVSKDDDEMNQAIAEGQKSFDQFLTARTEQGEGFGGMVKVYFHDDSASDEGEHMWVGLEEENDDEYSGVLISSPSWLTSVSQGDTVHFGRADITDWLFIDQGKAMGAFTIKLLRSRMGEEERAAHDANYPFSFD